MREFTKSMFSLSWAMSMFGLKQMAGLFTPGANTAASFEAVTRCAEDQLGPATRSTFRAGDNLQRGLVDLTFGLFTLGLWQPNRGGGGAGWGSGGWGRCDTGRRDAGQQAAGTQAAPRQQGGWPQGEVGQPGSGWEQGGLGGGWRVGGGGGSSSSDGSWMTSGGSSVVAAGAETVRTAGDLTASAMSWGIDMMQQGANTVAQTLGGTATQQQPARGGDYQTSGGGSDRR